MNYFFEDLPPRWSFICSRFVSVFFCGCPLPQVETFRHHLAIWMKKTVMMSTGRKRESQKGRPVRATISFHPKSWYTPDSVISSEPTAFLWTHHRVLIKCSAAFWSSTSTLISTCFIHPCFWTANFIESTKGRVRSQHHPPGRPLHYPYSLCEYSLIRRIKENQSLDYTV